MEEATTDAIQAAAQEDPAEIVSLDDRLIDAARREGFPVVDLEALS